jgi:hypothetical protein
MGIDQKGRQGQTQRAVVLQEEENVRPVLIIFSCSVLLSLSNLHFLFQQYDKPPAPVDARSEMSTDSDR